jgi:hypothetical protein
MQVKLGNVMSFVIGALLVGVIGTGTAVAASGTGVNILDPTTSVGAKVTSGGRLEVNSNGAVAVTGPVVTAPTLWSATVRVVPASTDTRTCVQVPLPASGKVMLNSVAVTDYFSPSFPIAYIKPYVKTGSSTGQVLQQRITLITSEPDPTANLRTGFAQMPLVLASGGFGAANVGETYDLYACINHVSGESAQANFLFAGTVS